MDEDRAVGLHDQQPEGGREMGGEPAVVVDAAPRDDESHLRTVLRTSRCRLRVAISDQSKSAAPIELTAVSPRKTRKTRLAPPPAPLGPERIEDWPDGDWVVRPVPGAAATKPYRCPGCDQELYPGIAHVVVWPTHAGVTSRRHWHTVCWQRRLQRRPG